MRGTKVKAIKKAIKFKNHEGNPILKRTFKRFKKFYSTLPKPARNGFFIEVANQYK